MVKKPNRKLSREGERVLRQLGYEVIDAANKYGQFKVLFLSGQENLDLLSNTAPGYFEYAGESTLRDVIMTLARLCDRPNIGKQDNLVFERLAAELPGLWRPRYLAKLQKLKKRLAPLLKWRNKRLAHNDLNHALRTKRLPKLRYERIHASIKQATALLNQVNRYKRIGYTGYDMPITPKGADFLINHLDLARKAFDRGVHLL